MIMGHIQIRKYQTTDCEEMVRLFYDTVHSVNAADYSKEQLDAWASGDLDKVAWDLSFLAHDSVVAAEHEKIVGFGDMDDRGYLDRIFVHKDYQGIGVAAAICDALEKNASESGINLYFTHASITAKGFFQRRGYEVVKEQQVERKGILLTNFVMEKSVKG
jgi:putative acetyltransferase